MPAKRDSLPKMRGVAKNKRLQILKPLNEPSKQNLSNQTALTRFTNTNQTCQIKFTKQIIPRLKRSTNNQQTKLAKPNLPKETEKNQNHQNKNY